MCAAGRRLARPTHRHLRLGSRYSAEHEGVCGRTERVRPRISGLRRHAMRVARVLRGAGGVGAESHRVTGSQGGRFEESRDRGAATLRAGKQAGRRRGTNGTARLTRANTCDEAMVAWQASRRQVWRRHRQARRRQAWRAARWALGRRRSGTWVGAVRR